MILVAPTSFKGTITARAAAAALAAGARDARPHDEVIELPVSDGGPGLIDALTATVGGDVEPVRVPDPLGRDVDARVLLVPGDALAPGVAAVDAAATGAGGDVVAIVESADACGMHLLARDELAPLRLGSDGVGTLIEAAARRAGTVVVGLGGSATVDGGVGMARALGWRFLDADGRDLEPGGAALRRLERIVAPSPRAAPRGVASSAPALPRVVASSAPARPRVVALADVTSPLTGALGAARVFGPQKGASAADVELLEAGLARLAEVVRRDVGPDVAALPGAGAAGGLGAACVAFLGASLERGADWLLGAVGFDALLARASLVVTGEGSFDAQSSMGKVTGEVIARAGRAGVPVLLVAGRAEGELPAHVRASSGDGGVLDETALRGIVAREFARASA